MPWRENKGVANLDGIYTDFFIHGAHGGHGFFIHGIIWGVASQDVLEEIFNKNMACGQKQFYSITLHKYNL